MKWKGEGEFAGLHGVPGRPSIGGATKVTPELGVGTPLNKEPHNGLSAVRERGVGGERAQRCRGSKGGGFWKWQWRRVAGMSSGRAPPPQPALVRVAARG